MTTETILREGQIIDLVNAATRQWRRNDNDLLYLEAGRAIEQAVLRSHHVSRWAEVNEGEPNCNGTYVLRINRHGHLRLGYRVLNSDTLRYQWQVDGEICNTVTHYLPIPALTLSERES